MTSKIVRADGVTELTSIQSVTYTETVNAGENLKPGCVASASISVNVYGTTPPSQGEALTYYQVDENNNATLIGVFYAEPSVPAKNMYSFVAYDAVSKLDKPYSERLNTIQANFPMSIYDLVSDACTYAGVTLGSSSWPLSTQNVQAFYADNLSCRNILQYAAELAGRFVRCNTSGEVIFDWYTTNTDYSIHPGASQADYIAYRLGGLEYSSYAVKAVSAVAIKPSDAEGAAYIYPSSYSAISVTDQNGDGNLIISNITCTDDGHGNVTMNVGAEDDGNANVTILDNSDGNTLVISGNLLLTSASSTLYNTAAQNLYTVMSALPTYRYADIQLFRGENQFRSGEFVSVTDSNGVSFYAPVFTMTESPNGAALRSYGRESYSVETETSVEKEIQNLASNIVQINKLKVSWADIQEAIVQYLKLYGEMTVYTDDTLTTSGGSLGYGTGGVEYTDPETLEHSVMWQQGIILRGGGLSQPKIIVSSTGNQILLGGNTETLDLRVCGAFTVFDTDVAYIRRIGKSTSSSPIGIEVIGNTVTVSVKYSWNNAVTANSTGWQSLGQINLLSTEVNVPSLSILPSDVLYFTAMDFYPQYPTAIAMKIESGYLYYYASSAGDYAPCGSVTYVVQPPST